MDRGAGTSDGKEAGAASEFGFSVGVEGPWAPRYVWGLLGESHRT